MEPGGECAGPAGAEQAEAFWGMRIDVLVLAVAFRLGASHARCGKIKVEG